MRLTIPKRLPVLLGAGLLVTTGAARAADGHAFLGNANCDATWTMQEQHAGRPTNFTMFESKADLDEFRKQNCSPSQVTARVNQQICNKAEINPVTGHTLCIDPLGAPVEPLPDADLAPCKPARQTGSWTYGPNCKPQPAG